MQLLHRHLSRYAVFEVESEGEALDALKRAAASMYDSPPEFIGFGEEGYLISKQTEDDEEQLAWNQQQQEFDDETVHVAKFERGTHLLSIELYDDVSDPGDPLHADNVLMAKKLERMCQEPPSA